MPRRVVGDRGYGSGSFRELIRSSGARPAIPTRRDEAAVARPDFIYGNRNLVERLRARLEERRAVATRYGKTELCFTGVLCLAAGLDQPKRQQGLTFAQSGERLFRIVRKDAGWEPLCPLLTTAEPAV